jgi:hypothetical protein
VALEERRKQEQQRLVEQQKTMDLRDKALYEERVALPRKLALERFQFANESINGW